MKRYVSLACIAMVLVMCLVSPVSANDLFSYNYINVLDYSTVNNSGSNQFDIWGSPTRISYTLPGRTIVNDIDIVFYCGQPITSVSFIADGSIFSASVTYLGSNLYRASSDLQSLAPSTIYIDVSSSVYGVAVQVVSFTFSSIMVDSFDIDAYCKINAYDYDKTIHYISSDDVNYRTFTGATDYTNLGYTLYIYTDKWKNYDYIDYLLFTAVDSITSITCTYGEQSIPFEISYIDNDPMSINDYCYSIRVDCRGLDKSLGDDYYPQIIVMGNVISDHVNMISMMGCRGFIITDYPNSDLHWYTRIFNAISSGFNNLSDWIGNQTSSIVSSISSQTNSITSWIDSQTTSILSAFSSQTNSITAWIDSQTATLESAIRGDTSPGNSFQQQVDQKDQQLNDMATVMESVDQPDLNSVNVSANTYVDGTVLAASMSGITSVFSQGLFFDMIVMSIMMATAGYVLFGKR